MYTRGQLRNALEKCFQASAKVEARMHELQRLNNEFKNGKRDAAPSTEEWLQVLVEHDFIRAKMREIKETASDLLS